jgi:hypothetical protein
MSTKDDAKQIINDFAARTGGLWSALDRAKVAAGARARIDDPNIINQKEASVCGPACFVHAVALDAPQDYARAIVDLYEQGKACLGGRARCLALKPSKDLMNYTLPATVKVDPADWIIMASIRDSENWFFNYSSVTDNGGTRSGELADWFKEAGYTDVTDHSYSLLGNYPGLWAHEATELYGKGYKVCLRINSNMLHVATQDDNSWKSNHLVGLASPITFNDKTYPPFKACYYEGRHRECQTFAGNFDPKSSTVALKVYTWGGVRDVPETGTLSWSSFMENFYGYVAAKY